jgi:putative salt-induced outer membrane protein YdiY
MRLKKILPAVVSALVLSAPVFSQDEVAVDKIVLNNGSVILGTVTGARDGAVSIDTDFAGALSISLEDIASLSTNTPMDIQLADKSLVSELTLDLQGDTLELSNIQGDSQELAVEELLVLNPEPWEVGLGYKWTGRAGLAFALERGNTDTDEIDYSLNSVWRSDDDRYTLDVTGEMDEANDVKSADNWTTIGKYDYFLGDRNYWGVNAYAESDEFADLDLRYFVGPYIGREFYTDPLFRFSAEVGASYVNENFIVAEDQEYAAGNWHLNMSSNYLGGDSLLYFKQLGVWNLEQTDEVIINSTFGLSFPLLWNLSAAAEILLDYDSGAVEGVEEVDQTYKLNIGYSW